MLMIPNKPNLTITYTNPQNTAGYINDPFFFNNMTAVIENPSEPSATASEPAPAASPSLAVINANISQIITPFTQSSSSSSGGGGGGTVAIDLVFPETIVVEQDVTQILNQQVSLDDTLTKQHSIGCLN